MGDSIAAVLRNVEFLKGILLDKGLPQGSPIASETPLYHFSNLNKYLPTN